LRRFIALCSQSSRGNLRRIRKIYHKKQNSRRLFHFLHSVIIEYQPPLLAVVKGCAVCA